MKRLAALLALALVVESVASQSVPSEPPAEIDYSAIANNSGHLFPIASMTKNFPALAKLKLRDQGHRSH